MMMKGNGRGWSLQHLLVLGCGLLALWVVTSWHYQPSACIDKTGTFTSVKQMLHADVATKPKLDLGLEDYDVLIVGAGLSGTIFADLLARYMNKRVYVIDRRDHIGGNCFDFRNEDDLLISRYGAHLFHTHYDHVWQYVHRFSDWTPYEHRVVGKVDGELIPIPVNIDTVNTIFKKHITTQKDMEAFMDSVRFKTNAPKNGEEAAMARVGRELYEKIFLEYTYKQWNVSPKQLNASVLQRIPVRTNWDDR
jgi:UDP-galactopyranose mutase